MKRALAILIVGFSATAVAVAAAIAVRPLPNPDGPLEPSVQNEVDRACDLGDRWLAADARRAAETNRVPAALDLFATNGVLREAVARRLVSSQHVADGLGHWADPRPASVTNRVGDVATTRCALEILKGL